MAARQSCIAVDTFELNSLYANAAGLHHYCISSFVTTLYRILD